VIAMPAHCSLAPAATLRSSALAVEQCMLQLSFLHSRVGCSSVQFLVLLHSPSAGLASAVTHPCTDAFVAPLVIAL
jgi:hypothetical protein